MLTPEHISYALTMNIHKFVKLCVCKYDSDKAPNLIKYNKCVGGNPPDPGLGAQTRDLWGNTTGFISFGVRPEV